MVFIVSIIRQESLLETLQFALVLVVAAIPAAMPAVLSITMAVGGATALARKEAIVSRLVAIEEMAGGVDVLCTDKTGTITENRLTLADVVPFEGSGRTTSCLPPSSRPAKRTGTPPSTSRSSSQRRRRTSKNGFPLSPSLASSPSMR